MTHLTPAELQAVNLVISKLNGPFRRSDIARDLGCHPTQLSAFVTVLRKIGVSIGKDLQCFDPKELAEFLAWKAAQAEAGVPQ